jgi:hypothetical protein
MVPITHNLIPGHLNDFGEVDAAISKVSEGYAKSFCKSWVFQKATRTKSFK